MLCFPQGHICEIGSGLVKRFTVYSGSEIHIWVNIGSSWEKDGAVMREEAAVLPQIHQMKIPLW